MPCSFHPHLHPSFVLVFSSHQCENTQETFTTMGLFTHLLLIRDFECSLEAYSSGEPTVFYRKHNTFTNQAPDVRFSRLGWR